MKFLRKLFDKAIRQIARKQLSADYAGYLQSMKEAWYCADRRRKAYIDVCGKLHDTQDERDNLAQSVHRLKSTICSMRAKSDREDALTLALRAIDPCLEWKNKCTRLERMWEEIHVENVALRRQLRERVINQSIG